MGGANVNIQMKVCTLSHCYMYTGVQLYILKRGKLYFSPLYLRHSLKDL